MNGYDGLLVAAFLAGIAVGAFVWIPGALRWNDRRWEERLRRNLRRYGPR